MTDVMGLEDSGEIIPLLVMVDQTHQVIWLLGLRLSPCSFRHGAKSVKHLKLYEKCPFAFKCDPLTFSHVY